MSNNKPPVLELWPGGPPDGLLQHPQPEREEVSDGPGGLQYRRIHLVSNPTLTVYHPPAEIATDTAVVIFPGGAYRFLAADHEGVEIAEWLNGLGITAILVQYRTSRAEAAWPPVPEEFAEVLAASLADAQRAMRLVRHCAAEWKLDPQRIGTIGFSAGGNLIMRLACGAHAGDPDAADPVERCSARPDFSIFLYPAVMWGIPEIPADMGPSFLVNAADDDATPVHGAIQFYQALAEKKINTELHIYPAGGHGFGLGKFAGAIGAWPDLCAHWIPSVLAPK